MVGFWRHFSTSSQTPSFERIFRCVDDRCPTPKRSRARGWLCFGARRSAPDAAVAAADLAAAAAFGECAAAAARLARFCLAARRRSAGGMSDAESLVELERLSESEWSVSLPLSLPASESLLERLEAESSLIGARLPPAAPLFPLFAPTVGERSIASAFAERPPPTGAVDASSSSGSSPGAPPGCCRPPRLPLVFFFGLLRLTSFRRLQ